MRPPPPPAGGCTARRSPAGTSSGQAAAADNMAGGQLTRIAYFKLSLVFLKLIFFKLYLSSHKKYLYNSIINKYIRQPSTIGPPGRSVMRREGALA